LRCGTCKSTVYCSSKCQREDWRFHKRNCKKPEAPVPAQSAAQGGPSEAESMAAMEAELAKQDPKMAAQVKEMMAGMGLGGEKKQKVEEPKQVVSDPCKNCAAPCVKPLRCGVCKAATYCSAKCQKEDWQFHKRNCKKPSPAPKTQQDLAQAAAPQNQTAGETPSTSAPRPKAPEDRVVESEDVGSWYKHREWKPAEEKKEFTPQQVQSAGGAEGAKAPAAGSTWNAAGTWEEKRMLPWWEAQLASLKGISLDPFGGTSMSLTVDSVSKAEGEAEIQHIRGVPRFFFDLRFDVGFTYGYKTSSRKYSGHVKVTEFSNDSATTDELFTATIAADSEGDKRKVEAELLPRLRAVLREKVTEYESKAGAGNTKAFPGQLPPAAS